ncbi:MAG: hypothetical protein R6X13_00495 [bacterium]
MSRRFVSVAAAALLVGCARPAVQDLLTDQQYEDSAPVEVAAAPTTIVREVHYQAPEVYVDTVYLEYEAPAETVYVEEPVEYEYETYVYISEPPPHHFPHPRMSPPGHGGHGSRGGHVPRGGSDPRERQEPRGRGQRPPDGGERPRGGGQPRQPDPPERPRPVVGPTDGPKRTEPPRSVEPAPTPAVPAPSRPQTRPVRSESPSTPAVQSPESDDAVFTIPVRDVKPIPVDRSGTAEAGS